MKYLIFNSDATTGPGETSFVRAIKSDISPTVGDSSFVEPPDGYAGDFAINEIYYWPSEQTILRLFNVDPENIDLAIAITIKDVDAIIWIGRQ